MAFLGKPKLGFGTPFRPSPTAPGTVEARIEIPLFIELLERCFVANCDGVAKAPMFQIVAEVWSTDRNEPIGTAPIGPDRNLFTWFWALPGTNFKRVSGQDVSSANAVTGDPTKFLFNLTDKSNVAESSLNEDWGPFPPPSKPPIKQTEDELFLRVYLSSIFSAWQTVQTIDSDIVKGQFYGP